MAKDFHSRCDNKGPLVSLFQIKDGDVVGGYSKAQFSPLPYPGERRVDECAILFNLDEPRQQVYPSQKGDQYGGILCRNDLGPCYGNAELGAYKEPFNGNGNCYSYANSSGYRIPKDGDKNRLTNQQDKNFTITELEVWQVTEMVSDINILIDTGSMKKHRIREK